MAGGLLALYHLVTHWSWVKAVSARLPGKTSSKARLYYLVDALLLAGFTGIVSTGLVISSWFNLELANYALWRSFHIIASVTTLLTLVVKLGLHWRWIVTTTRKVFGPSVQVPAPRPTPSGAPARHPAASAPALSRRDFLKVMGGVGAASLFALGSSLKGLQDSIQVVQAGAQAQTISAAQPDAQTQDQATAATGATATAAATAITAATATTAATTSAAASGSTTSGCVVRCNKGCSFPGRCKRYTDSNGNKRCDLGECL